MNNVNNLTAATKSRNVFEFTWQVSDDNRVTGVKVKNMLDKHFINN